MDKKKKIIIFDMDGVLFDTIGFAKESLLKRHPGMTGEMIQDINSGNYHEELKKYSHLRKPETEEEREQRLKHYAEQKSMMPMFLGAKELLEDLRKDGYLLALNTGAFNQTTLPLLENSGIKDLFDFLATSELSKDKVEKFKLIQEEYKVDKKDMLFITDALGDVKEAEISGVPTIAVTWGIHDRKFFEKEKHNNLIGIVDSVQELENFIKKY